MDIQHEAAAQRFQISDAEGLAGELSYRAEGRLLVFSHTRVRPSLRGQGLAARLVEAGLQWAEQQGLQVVPACSYVADYMNRHPRWQGLARLNLRLNASAERASGFSANPGVLHEQATFMQAETDARLWIPCVRCYLDSIKLNAAGAGLACISGINCVSPGIFSGAKTV